MAIHYVVIADLTNSHNDIAIADISSDDAQSATVQVGATSNIVAIDLNTRFASSPELFAIAGFNPPALVSILMPGGGVKSSVILRQNKLVMAVPTTVNSLGMQFRFPLADTARGAILLVGNPSGSAASLTIVIGTTILPTPPQIQPGAAMAISLGSNSTPNARVSVNSNVPVVVQLAIVGKGQDFSMTFIEIGG